MTFTSRLSPSIFHTVSDKNLTRGKAGYEARSWKLIITIVIVPRQVSECLVSPQTTLFPVVSFPDQNVDRRQRERIQQTTTYMHALYNYNSKLNPSRSIPLQMYHCKYNCIIIAHYILALITACILLLYSLCINQIVFT